MKKEEEKEGNLKEKGSKVNYEVNKKVKNIFKNAKMHLRWFQQNNIFVFCPPPARPHVLDKGVVEVQDW